MSFNFPNVQSLVEATGVKFDVSIPLTLGGLIATSTALHFLPVPRVGLGRVWAVGIQSLLRWPSKSSQRKDLVGQLQQQIKGLDAQQYIVVTGARGHGKSLLVDTALRWSPGVMTVRVPAGASETEIKREVYSTITHHTSFVYAQPSALRVLRLHALIFRRPATMVLQVAEREPGEDYAQVTAAVRSLATLPLRVVVDASDNSLPPSATATAREQEVTVPPMTRAQIEAMEELQGLLEALRGAGLQDEVWHVTGGSPAKYIQLLQQWKAGGAGNAEAAAAQFVKGQLLSALKTREAAMQQAGPTYEKLLQRFQTEDAVPLAVLAKERVISPSPDKVLRLVEAPSSTSGRPAPSLVPADAAMGLVLRYNLQDALSLSELKDLLQAAQQAAASSPPAQ